MLNRRAEVSATLDVTTARGIDCLARPAHVKDSGAQVSAALDVATTRGTDCLARPAHVRDTGTRVSATLDADRGCSAHPIDVGR